MRIGLDGDLFPIQVHRIREYSNSAYLKLPSVKFSGLRAAGAEYFMNAIEPTASSGTPEDPAVRSGPARQAGSAACSAGTS